MSKLNDIVEKIRKLQRKAQDASLTEAESAAFAAKVAELLIEHSLDPSVLKEQETAKIAVETEMYSRNYTHPWRTSLADAVARLYFCKVLIITVAGKTEYTNSKKRMLFIGKAHNRAVAISMLEHFENTIKRLAVERYSGRGDIANFEKGCGLRLADRIHEHYRRLNRVITGIDKSIPVLYQSEEKEVQVVYERYNPRTGKSLKVDSGNRALLAGMQAADKISLSEQVRHTDNRVRLLG